MGAFSGLLSLIALTVFASTNIGDRMPEFVEGAQWVKGKAPVLENSLTIVELWRSSCSNCRAQIPHLSALQKTYGDRVSIVTISSEPIDVLNQFLKEHGDEVSYTIGHISKDLMVKINEDTPGVPYCFIINKKGVIVWQGHPKHIEDVLDNILDGSIDVEKMKKITILEKTLNDTFDKHNVAETTQVAKNLLAVDPGNILALETIINIDIYTKDRALVKDAFNNAPMKGLSAVNADTIAGMLVSDNDQNFWYPDLAIKYSTYALGKDPDNSRYLNTYARALFCNKDFGQAVVYQKKALKLEPDNNIYQNNLNLYSAFQKGGK
jgi:cytochrome c biogenesis protein CcmG, thiol:disulfide interchange protein DsbE